MVLMLAPAARAVDDFLVLRVSTPFIFSASAGLRFGGETYAPTLQGEVGVGGGKIAVGLDGTGHNKVGLGLKAAFLRTWIEPVDVEKDQSFLGVEGELSIYRLVANLGGYRRVGDGEDDWLLAAGLGFYF